MIALSAKLTISPCLLTALPTQGRLSIRGLFWFCGSLDFAELRILPIRFQAYQTSRYCWVSHFKAFALPFKRPNNLRFISPTAFQTCEYWVFCCASLSPVEGLPWGSYYIVLGPSVDSRSWEPLHGFFILFLLLQIFVLGGSGNRFPNRCSS